MVIQVVLLLKNLKDEGNEHKKAKPVYKNVVVLIDHGEWWIKIFYWIKNVWDIWSIFSLITAPPTEVTKSLQCKDIFLGNVIWRHACL